MDGPTLGKTRTRTIHAPAKINLSLHVVGRRADGYHLLDGLVAFTEIGDTLEICEGESDRLLVDGPLEAGVPVEGNILMTALALARRIAAERGLSIPLMDIRLTKNLPAAAGIGGGSADAAALLRHIGERWPSLRASLSSAAATLGADVPMCLAGSPARISGIGERVEPLTAMPPLHLVLVNPRVAVPTPQIFARLQKVDNPPPPAIPARGFETGDAVVDYLIPCRNDLSDPAEIIAPLITDAKSLLDARDARLARMSGSGATVFGVFDTAAAANDSAEAIRRERPAWWVVATRSFGARNGEDAP